MKRNMQAVVESGRIELVIRMLQLQARTRTIMSATGLSEDQVRRLYRQYCRGQVAVRRRGRSPTSVAGFLRSLPRRYEATLFAGVLLKHGLLVDVRQSRQAAHALAHARRFCHAYAEYLTMAHYEPMSFEHAWYFARNLAAKRDLSLRRCVECGAHHVHDDTTVRRQSCPVCAAGAQWRVQSARLRNPRKFTAG